MYHMHFDIPIILLFDLDHRQNALISWVGFETWIYTKWKEMEIK